MQSSLLRRIWQKQKAGFIFFLLVFLTLLAVLANAGLMQARSRALTPGQRDVLVFGHAGSGFLSPLNPFNPYPANSMTSLLQALDAGAQGLEVDVHLSRDGVPVLFHDPQLAPMTPATGLIEELPAAAVLGLPYRGGFFYDLFQHEKVTSFEALLQQFARYPRRPHLHVDLRQEGQPRSAYFARVIMGLLRRYQYPVTQLSFISPEVELLQAFRREEPRAAYLVDSKGDFEETRQKALRHQLSGVVYNGKDVDAARMAQLRRDSLQVVLFGPKTKGSIYRLLLLEPDAVEINNVPATVDLLSGY